MTLPAKILAVLNRGRSDSVLIAKASQLAARLDARLELFLCDAEHAYAMKHEYEPSHNVEFHRDCVDKALGYLTDIRRTVRVPHERVAISAVCESPLYEGITRKVEQSRPGLVLKSAGGQFASPPVFDSNDWQLMRKCPATLLMTRGRTWRTRPRFAAAVDVSAQETEGLTASILQTAEELRAAHDGELDVLYVAPSNMAQAAKDVSEKLLRNLARTANVATEEVIVLHGSPETTLPPFVAEQNYDVLVLGALTHRPGVATLVGTLTSKIVETADCDFVLVKPSTAG